MNNNFYYQTGEVDSLIFKPTRTGFELFSKGENTSEMKLANYESNEWKFDDQSQKNLFFTMMALDKKSFQRAFKAYFRNLEQPDSFVVLSCAKRKFVINFTKMYRKLQDRFYSSIYPTR